jgi:hypothetical protein
MPQLTNMQVNEAEDGTYIFIPKDSQVIAKAGTKTAVGKDRKHDLLASTKGTYWLDNGLGLQVNILKRSA